MRVIKTSPLISILLGGFFVFSFFGISLIVFIFSVTTSPTSPLPLVTPSTKCPFSYIKFNEIPSILGSTEYSKLEILFPRKLKTFFSKFSKSSSSIALSSDNMRVGCVNLVNCAEGSPPILVNISIFFKIPGFFSFKIFSLETSSSYFASLISGESKL